jgi:hypothetical protein
MSHGHSHGGHSCEGESADIDHALEMGKFCNFNFWCHIFEAPNILSQQI